MHCSTVVLPDRTVPVVRQRLENQPEPLSQSRPREYLARQVNALRWLRMPAGGDEPFEAHGSWLRLIRTPFVWAGQEMATACLVCPVFPGAPCLDRVRTVTSITSFDLSPGQVLDFTP